jgi:phenol 2-monooxygenase (NADPH)
VATTFTQDERIFLAGDAVHTHSPKAGQGMNVSMQDTYNLGWKLGSVLSKTAPPSILSTYESERRPIAKQLIEFDTKFSRMFSGKPAKDAADQAGISMEEFKKTFETGNTFTSGISVMYSPSSIVACSEDIGKEATRFGVLQVGARFASFQVVGQSDAVPRQLGEMLTSNGSWRLIVFAGDVTKAASLERLRVLGHSMKEAGTCLQRWIRTPAIRHNDQDDVPLLSPMLVHSSARRDVEFLEMPKVFYTRSFQSSTNGDETRPHDLDYFRVFANDESYHHGHGNAYENYGVDKERGRMVLVRPDQYVSWMSDVEDIAGLEEFLEGITM